MVRLGGPHLIKWIESVLFAEGGNRIAARSPIIDIGERYERDGISVVYLRGNAYQRGFQHGYLCRDDLERFRKIAWNYAPKTATERLGVPMWIARYIKYLLFVLAGSYLPNLNPDVREEMQGLSDGADVDIREVAVLTLIWEIFAIFPAQPAKKPEHCSEIAIDQTRSKDGLFGYNYDVLVASDRSLVEGFMALFVVEPSDGGSGYIAPNTIGSIGLNTALNQAGVVFGWDNSYLKPGVSKGGNKTPYMVLLREIALHAHSREDALARFRQEQRQEADISVVLDHDGASVVEIAGIQVADRTAAIVWSCNRLQTLATLDYEQVGRVPDGRHTRYQTLVNGLNQTTVNAADLAAILRDGDTENGRPIASSNTAFTAIYDLAGTVWLSFEGSPSSCQQLYAFDTTGQRREDKDL